MEHFAFDIDVAVETALMISTDSYVYTATMALTSPEEEKMILECREAIEEV